MVEGMIDNRPPAGDRRDPFMFLRAACIELADLIAGESTPEESGEPPSAIVRRAGEQGHGMPGSKDGDVLT